MNLKRVVDSKQMAVQTDELTGREAEKQTDFIVVSPFFGLVSPV